MSDNSDELSILRERVNELTQQVAANQAALEILQDRASVADVRADSSEARADAAELRADVSEARADEAEFRADASEVRADKSEARVDTHEGRIDALEVRVDVDREMIAELQADVVLSQEHAVQMEEALRSSRVIGAAIGIVMQSRRVDEDAAFAILSLASQRSNRKLRVIAEEIVGADVPRTAGPRDRPPLFGRTIHGYLPRKSQHPPRLELAPGLPGQEAAQETDRFNGLVHRAERVRPAGLSDPADAHHQAF